MNKPEPLANVYDWNKLEEWLCEVAPSVACELGLVVRGWSGPSGVLHGVDLPGHARGDYGIGLSPSSIAWLRENVAPDFWLRVWW